MTLLPDAARFGAFLVASTALAVTPGPAVVFIVARTVAQGARIGLASIAGVALGNLGNAWGASLGLAALIVAWPGAFDAVRVAGAAWLLWLAWQAWRAPVATPRAGAEVRTAVGSARRAFVDGAAVALLNPKTAVFFAAFLPQFMTPGADGAAAGQAMVLSTAFVAIASCTDAAWVLLASRAAPRLAGLSDGRFAARASAAVFAALAVGTLLAGRPA